MLRFPLLFSNPRPADRQAARFNFSQYLRYLSSQVAALSNISLVRLPAPPNRKTRRASRFSVTAASNFSVLCVFTSSILVFILFQQCELLQAASFPPCGSASSRHCFRCAVNFKNNSSRTHIKNVSGHVSFSASPCRLPPLFGCVVCLKHAYPYLRVFPAARVREPARRPQSDLR